MRVSISNDNIAALAAFEDPAHALHLAIVNYAPRCMEWLFTTHPWLARQAGLPVADHFMRAIFSASGAGEARTMDALRVILRAGARLCDDVLLTLDARFGAILDKEGDGIVELMNHVGYTLIEHGLSAERCVNMRDVKQYWLDLRQAKNEKRAAHITVLGVLLRRRRDVPRDVALLIVRDVRSGLSSEWAWRSWYCRAKRIKK